MLTTFFLIKKTAVLRQFLILSIHEAQCHLPILVGIPGDTRGPIDNFPLAAPTFAISAIDASKAEGTCSASTPFVFTVTRSGDASNASSVRYSVSGTGSNKANSNDFTGGFPSNVLVDFTNGTTAVDVTILVNADSTVERNERFKVTLA